MGDRCQHGGGVFLGHDDPTEVVNLVEAADRIVARRCRGNRAVPGSPVRFALRMASLSTVVPRAPAAIIAVSSAGRPMPVS